MTRQSRASSIALLIACVFGSAWAASKSQPHPHQGILTPYDGKHIPYELTKEEAHKLDKNEAVIKLVRGEKEGRGLVVQDVAAPPEVCMDILNDFEHYPKRVPYVKSVELYDKVTHPNGTETMGAEFKVKFFGFGFGYFLRVTHSPKLNTVTWTLDYQYHSDFDDNVGHWQVMPHPHKIGWSRILYSTEVKVPNWIPEFVINMLTKNALTESTGWVKKEVSRRNLKLPFAPGPDLSARFGGAYCFEEGAFGVKYGPCGGGR